MATKAGKRDLRSTSADIEAVKSLADKMFGFHAYRVTPLETTSGSPSEYCMFEVGGVQYQVRDGVLSIHAQGEE